jgi:hypothetical protein
MASSTACSATGTCPKIVETFGGAEVFALKMTTSWVGTDPKNDIPLPDNVRRYYLPSSTHGGGSGNMDENPSANGNELGGIPTLLRDAPLGTYLGWNITSAGFHVGQSCNYVGGMVPFAKTKAARLAAKDPRPSLEERYGTHDGFVAAVKAAANNAACQGYLLAGPAAAAMGAKCTRASIPAGFPDDWAALVTQAMNSNVCNQPGDGGKCNPTK